MSFTYASFHRGRTRWREIDEDDFLIGKEIPYYSSSTVSRMHHGINRPFVERFWISEQLSRYYIRFDVLNKEE